jgi:hypothetical protein
MWGICGARVARSPQINNNAVAIVTGQKGAWNDADMLEVGNFFGEFGEAEGRTNFALWCLMKFVPQLQ